MNLKQQNPQVCKHDEYGTDIRLSAKEEEVKSKFLYNVSFFFIIL